MDITKTRKDGSKTIFIHKRRFLFGLCCILKTKIQSLGLHKYVAILNDREDKSLISNQLIAPF